MHMNLIPRQRPHAAGPPRRWRWLAAATLALSPGDDRLPSWVSGVDVVDGGALGDAEDADEVDRVGGVAGLASSWSSRSPGLALLLVARPAADLTRLLIGTAIEGG